MSNLVFPILLSTVIKMYDLVDKLPRLGRREQIFLRLFTHYSVDSVKMGFSFPLLLWICCFDCLGHSLGLLYNRFELTFAVNLSIWSQTYRIQM